MIVRDIQWDKNLNLRYRAGVTGAQCGISFEAFEASSGLSRPAIVEITPLNRKGEDPGSCGIQIPLDIVPNVVNALQQVAKEFLEQKPA